MNLFERLSVSRAIAVVANESQADTLAVERARDRLEQAGARAVPRLIEALAGSRNVAVLQEILAQTLGNESLPDVKKALVTAPPDLVDSLIPALGRQGRFDPNKLLDVFLDPDCRHKTVLAHALARHGTRIKGTAVLRLLDDLPSEDRAPVAWLLGQVASEALLPALAERLEQGDAVSRDLALRRAVIQAFGRLGGERAQATLIRLLDEDPRPEVRLSALDALMAIGEPPVDALCRRLRDGDMRVQSRTQDILAELDTPEIAQQVAAMLSDGEVETRRAAVEILNRKQGREALPALVEALVDEDWWVRGRAADAVAARGGRALIPAILPLLGRDPGERRSELVDLIRRLAGDQGITGLLVAGLEQRDQDLRRGTVRALATIGDAAAVEPLLALLEGGDTMDSEVLRALAQLGDPRAVKPLLARLQQADETEHESLFDALSQTTDSSRASSVVQAIRDLGPERDSASWRQLSEKALQTLQARFGDLLIEEQPATQGVAEQEQPPAASGHGPSESPMTPTLETLVPGKAGPKRRATIANIAPEAWSDLNPLSFKNGERLADRYNIIQQIGRGGFGVVVLAEDEIVGEQLILKFLAPHLAQDATAIQRFKHEIRYARRITHENVIRIYDMIALEGVFAIAMEYFPSHSLSAELHHEPRFALKHGLNVMRQVCRGLEEAHRVSVIHRDLKPGNILIDDQEQVKIVDFGLSAAATHGASRLTRSGLLLGTPTYMAPEQIEGHEIDQRVDIYSLGVLMYEMFTGRVPFEGPNAIATLFQHLDARVVAPRAVVPNLPEALETIILKAMARAPEARHPTAAALGAELDGLYTEVID